MLRFPLRLSADILAARFLRGASPIQFLDAGEILHSHSGHPVSHEKIREILSSRSPIVWIGGSEPLVHAGVAHLVRAIAQSGHFVFLETDGTLLRRRIHEFQPVSRLFLTVRLDPSAERRSPDALRPCAFELAVEGIRAAQLSGFFVCVLARVAPETQLSAVEELVHLANSRDADGILMLPAAIEADPASPAAQISRQKTSVARKLIGDVWWRSFSKLAEPLFLRGASAATTSSSSGQAEQESGADEEGVKVA